MRRQVTQSRILLPDLCTSHESFISNCDDLTLESTNDDTNFTPVLMHIYKEHAYEFNCKRTIS